MTQQREAARQMIRESIGGDEDTRIVFCGSGSTAAIATFLRMQGLHEAPIAHASRPVVIIGPFEHHSNELPWREAYVDLVVIGEDESGRVDLAELERELKAHAGRKIIGSFSAASNITGIVSQRVQICQLLKRHGALSCWDCAAFGPHARLDMDGTDALFISPHKYVGGPSTPGVLAVRQSAVSRHRIPAHPGGGTVVLVTEGTQLYAEEIEVREEAGTPNIVGAIRAGLVFDLQRTIGFDLIHQREAFFLRRAIEAWHDEPNIRLLGNLDTERHAIVSLLVTAADARQLHYNLVVAILSDVFGIQARGGCSCAGPYGARLLSLSDADVCTMATLVVDGYHGMKPGWTRIGFNYADTLEKVDFIVEAVRLVARLGHRLLPLYRFDPRTGHWAHISTSGKAPPQPSAALLLEGGPSKATHDRRRPREAYEACLAAAGRLLSRQAAERGPIQGVLPAACEAFRWFAY
jgi:selenocysteine lyase/cysteine desulfurase